jgi:two-component system sensor histidine kinase/response regulator
MKAFLDSGIPEILVAEDSVTQAEQLKRVLENDGFRVSVARDGRKALAALRTHKPTLVITDITMPEMDGYELCRRIRLDADLADLPVILLTSLSDPEDVFRGLQCGADNFITKPYEPNYLVTRIRHLLANAHLRSFHEVQMSMQVFFGGQKHTINSDRAQILNMLLSTYEAAVQRNRELEQTRDELRVLNDQLEMKVQERTASLESEIAERHRAERAVRELNGTLEIRVSERTGELATANRELESFSYSVSHDLRAPLRAIAGYSRILINRCAPALPDEGRRLLDNVINSAHRMSQLIDDLLRFSRLSRQPLSKGTVHIKPLVDEIVAELLKESGDRVIDFQVGDLPDCQGDTSLLRQVFFNLLSNAVKFTRAKQPAIVQVGCHDQPGEKVYFVRDNGAGFDMQYSEKLFGVFQRLHTTEEFEGTGIGLSIVQRIIQRHGGRVWAEAATNEGATFYFTLPAS